MLRYVCDNARHLVCLPYSIPNLHRMAAELGIKRCWFTRALHSGLAHYDIPKTRVAEIMAMCDVVDSKTIVEIIRNSGQLKLARNAATGSPRWVAV